jgi:hypothetical protein
MGQLMWVQSYRDFLIQQGNFKKKMK